MRLAELCVYAVSGPFMSMVPTRMNSHCIKFVRYNLKALYCHHVCNYEHIQKCLIQNLERDLSLSIWNVSYVDLVVQLLPSN